MNGFGKIVTKKYFTVAFPLPFPINNGYIHMYMRASEWDDKQVKQATELFWGQSMEEGAKQKVQSAAILILKFHDGVFLYNKKWIEIK